MARWALEMQQWDFDVKHRKGSLHQFPDALSRMYEQEELEAAAFEEVRDPWYLRMLKEVQDTPLKYKDWIVDEGKLYRYRKDRKSRGEIKVSVACRVKRASYFRYALCTVVGAPRRRENL